MTFLRKANTSFAMCTCLSLRGDHLYFARNMDLDCDFARTAVRAPRAFPLAGRRRHYAVAGVAQVREGIPYFAEGLNERGLYAAGLYFPDAVYAAKGMAPHVFMTSALALCASASEAARLLTNTDISGEGVDGPAPPLHWMLADRTRTLVVERRAEGLFVHENAFGVLTNSPPFPFHADNMRQYMGLSASSPACGWHPLTPFGVGFGGIGLPGDGSPASRFVRAAFLRANAKGASLFDVFGILRSLAFPAGLARTERGEERTLYSSVADADDGIFYYATDAHPRPCAVRLSGREEGNSLAVFPFPKAEPPLFADEA